MKTKILTHKLLAAAALLEVLDVVGTLVCAARLPATVPTHFDLHWVCDGVGSPMTAIWSAFVPVVYLVLGAVLTRGQSAQNRHIIELVMFLMTGMCVMGQAFLLAGMASGVQIGETHESPLVWPLLMGLAILFTAIGNELPRVRQNAMLGIRIRATLTDEACWRAVHRFAGTLWVIGGLILLAADLVMWLVGCPPAVGFTVLIVGTTLLLTVPVVYAVRFPKTSQKS